MDHQTLALFIPILALTIPVVAVVMSGLAKIARAKALSESDAGGELLPRVDALEQELGVVRQELSEAQERLDFAERMLARPDSGAQQRIQ